MMKVAVYLNLEGSVLRRSTQKNINRPTWLLWWLNEPA